MMTPPRIDDMTTSQAAKSISTAKVGIIPVGATEQHGPNLAFGTDWRIAAEIANRVAVEVDPLAVVVPPLPFGLSGHHLGFPGTLHISANTFMAVCSDVVTSLSRHGIKKILFVNGHRGNENVLGVLITELTYELGVEAASSFWMTQASDAVNRHKATERWGHACEIETSVAMAADPSLVAAELEKGDLIEEYDAFEDNYAPFSVMTARSFASRTKNGVFGDARKASLEAGNDILDTAVSRTAEFVRGFAARPPRTQSPAGESYREGVVD